MSYLANNLTSDEKILYRTKPHWIIFWPTLFFLVLSLLMYIFGLKQPALNTPFATNLNVLISRLALILAVVFTIPSLITYMSSEYVLTNKRLFMRTGFFHRVSLDIRLGRVESIEVQQTLLGQLMNYGSIVINGIGGSKDPFANITSPLVFRQKVQEQLENKTDLP